MVLLQLLDDGRLTDSQGHVVDFKNTIVIMTSNIGSHLLMDKDADFDTKRQNVMGELRKFFRPEFINRVDEIVVFHPLEQSDLRHIVDIQLEDLRKRLADLRIVLALDDGAKDALAEEGYDPVYGARPLKRTLRRRLESPLSRKLIAGEIKETDSVQVGFKEGDFTFTVE